MKKLLLTTVLLIIGILTSHAQVWIGASGNFNTGKPQNKFIIVNDKNFKLKHHTFYKAIPEIGYSFKNSPVSLGFAFYYQYEMNKLYDGRNNSYYDGYSSDKKCVFSPYLRINVCKIEKFTLFLDCAFDYVRVKTDARVTMHRGNVSYNLVNMHEKGNGWQAGIKPGIAFHPTKRWTAVFHYGFLGYGTSFIENEDNSANPENSGFNVDFSARIAAFGLYYNL